MNQHHTMVAQISGRARITHVTEPDTPDTLMPVTYLYLPVNTALHTVAAVAARRVEVESLVVESGMEKHMDLIAVEHRCRRWRTRRATRPGWYCECLFASQ